MDALARAIRDQSTGVQNPGAHWISMHRKERASMHTTKVGKYACRSCEVRCVAMIAHPVGNIN
eukprot:3136496-Rhodomonas_salina.2